MKPVLTLETFTKSKIPVWVYGFPTTGKSEAMRRLWAARQSKPACSDLIPDDSDSWFAWSTYQWDTQEGRPVLCDYARRICSLRGSPRVILSNLWWLEPKVQEVHFAAWVLPKSAEIAQARARARGSSADFISSIPGWLDSVNEYIAQHAQIRPVYLGSTEYFSDVLGL